MYRHVIQAASSAEKRLIKDLAGEFGSKLQVTVDTNSDWSSRIFFSTPVQEIASFVWFMLAKLKKNQRKLSEAYHLPADKEHEQLAASIEPITRDLLF